MSVSRYRLRRRDRMPDPRTHTFDTKDEAMAVFASIAVREQGAWEIVPMTRGTSGPSIPRKERSRKSREITLSPETDELLGRLAEHERLTVSATADAAIVAYAKAKRVK